MLVKEFEFFLAAGSHGQKPIGFKKEREPRRGETLTTEAK